MGKYCHKSQSQLQNIKSNQLFHFKPCNLTVLPRNFKPSFSATLYFNYDGVSINMYPEKNKKFVQQVDADIHAEEDLTLHILTDNNINLYHNHRFNCISVSKTLLKEE